MKQFYSFLMLTLALCLSWGTANAQGQPLPYDYGFEDDNLAIDGWLLQTPYDNGASQIYEWQYSPEGGYCFKFSYGEYGDSYLVSPLFDNSDQIIEVSFIYCDFSNIEKFQLGYTTDPGLTDASMFTDGEVVSTPGTGYFEPYSEQVPAGTKRIAIRYKYVEDHSVQLIVDQFSFSIPSCPKPTGLTATLTPGNGTVAHLSWTENGSAANWALEYSTSDDFASVMYIDNGFLVEGPNISVDLNMLTEGTTYYARVMSDCQFNGLSAYSNVISFTPTSALVESGTLTVNDGGYEGERVPVYGCWTDVTQRSEFIIPSSELSDMEGADVTSMLFYPTHSHDFQGTFRVYLKEVVEDIFEGEPLAFYTESGATTVYTGTLSCLSTEGMLVTFDNNFSYNGGNLLVGFYLENGVSSDYDCDMTFLGIEATGASIETHNSNAITGQDFLPKVTFGYEKTVVPPVTSGNLTVYDGENINDYVPVYGFYADAYSLSQFIIPADSLTDMASAFIDTLVFYGYGENDEANVAWDGAIFEVYMPFYWNLSLSSNFLN